MPQPLRVLIVEDNPDDAQLILRELKREGFDVTSNRVDTEAAFLDNLNGGLDLILSDFSMPEFNGMRALELVKMSGLEIPFILISGTIGEDIAVEAMKQGASDYLLKDRIARLDTAVRRALEQNRVRRERQRAEQQIRLQASALEATANAIVIFDSQGRIISANTAFCTMTGYTREEILGRNSRIFKSGEHPPEFYQKMWKSILSGQVWRGELTNRRKDGTLYNEEMTITPVRGEGGEITQFIAVKQDITEAKKAEEVVRKLTQREIVRGKFRMGKEVAIVLMGSALVYCFLASTNLLQAPLEELLKRKQLFDEIIGTLTALVVGLAILAYRRWKETRSQMRQQWLAQEALRTLHSELEARVQERTVELDKTNEALRAEISARATGSEALRESERRFREMLENVELIAMTLDVKGVVTFCNDYLLKLTGWKREEVIGCDWFARFIPESNSSLKQLFHETVAAGKIPPHHENAIKTRDGSLREIVWNNTALRDATGKIAGTASIGEDVTERKRTAEALQDSEEKFRQLAENSNEVFWIATADHSQILYISPAYEKIWGRSCKSLYENPTSFFEAVHGEDQEDLGRALERLTRGEKFDTEYRVVRPDGQIRWIHARGTSIRNADGVIYRVAGIAEDVTRRKETEKQFRQAQKMEGIGQLAGGVAHDFNNILMIIQVNLELVLMCEDNLGAESRERLAEIAHAAERAANLNRQLLTFSRNEATQMQLLNLNELTGSFIKMLRRIVGENIRIQNEFAASAPAIKADPGMVEQVLMNLAVNARDAMPNGGQLVIGTEVVEIDPEHSRLNPRTHPGRFVCLSVRDNGTGIAPENMSRIFEPFFTTKGVGRGTGLGLATVFGIAEQHKGWVDVSSELGVGTIFRVFFPLSSEDVAAATLAVRQTIAGGTEKILLVEDEKAVRNVLLQTLETYGYTVAQADSAVSAQKIWAEQGGDFDLLITDMVMPGGLTGLNLVELLRGQKPGLKIILASGYSATLARGELAAAKNITFLHKPISTRVLAETVRKCLDAPAPDS